MLPACVQRDLNGHSYYEFEYTVKNPRYTRHSLAVVVVNDGEVVLRHTVQQLQVVEQLLML